MNSELTAPPTSVDAAGRVAPAVDSLTETVRAIGVSLVTGYRLIALRILGPLPESRHKRVAADRRGIPGKSSACRGH